MNKFNLSKRMRVFKNGEEVWTDGTGEVFISQDVKEFINQVENIILNQNLTDTQKVYAIRRKAGDNLKQENKSKCIASINGKCDADYSPLKCNGIDIPNDCSYALKQENKSKEPNITERFDCWLCEDCGKKFNYFEDVNSHWNKFHKKQENKSNLGNTHTPKSSIIIQNDITKKGCEKWIEKDEERCGSLIGYNKIYLCEDCRKQDKSESTSDKIKQQYDKDYGK